MAPRLVSGTCDYRSRRKDMAMNTSSIRGLGILSLLLTSAATAQANDIVDFFRAINGVPAQRNATPVIRQAAYHSHGSSIQGGYGSQKVADRDINRRNGQRVDRDVHYLGYSQTGVNHGRVNHDRFESIDRVNLRNPASQSRGFRQPAYSQHRSGAQISFQVSSTGSPVYGQPLYIPTQDQVLPPVQPLTNYPQVPNYSQPSYAAPQALPHQVGDIVECRVPLATCVRIEDECKIAPNAVPIIVAVRDPNMCAHECCERVVFVQVCVPPCPPRSVRVSPCHTRVKMDFGRFEVDIKSKNGLIVIDYDN